MRGLCLMKLSRKMHFLKILVYYECTNLIFFSAHLPNSNPHTFGRISKICEHTGSSEHNWRAVKQLRAALEGLGVVKPAK